MNMAKIVNLVNVKKSYGNTPVLTSIDFSIEKGQLVVLLGPSGSGKTTLLNIIAGIDSADNGEVRISNHELTKMNDLELTEYRRDIVGYVFQFYNLLPNLTVLENAALGLELKGEDIAPAKVILEKIGLGDKSERFPAQLSGGEQQRVAIARALITNPKLILADEPTGALDPITSREVLKLFKQLHEESEVAFLLVTHNHEVASFCERSLELREGRFIAQHGTDVDIGDLSDSRKLIIDDTGTVTLPPDLLLNLGGPGRFEISDMNRDILHLERVEDEKILVSTGKERMVLSPSCPACKYDYSDSEVQLCPDCGSSRPMVNSSA